MENFPRTETIQEILENPDRMGGQFTEEEINRASEWR